MEGNNVIFFQITLSGAFHDNIVKMVSYSHGKTCALLNSFNTKIHCHTTLAASDVFICLHNQLSYFNSIIVHSFNSIIVQMSQKRDSSNRQYK